MPIDKTLFEPELKGLYETVLDLNAHSHDTCLRMFLFQATGGLSTASIYLIHPAIHSIAIRIYDYV